MEAYSEYLIHLVILMGIYAILAQSFNLNFGLGCQFNLAHVASYSIGAYATALLSTELEASFFVCILVSMLLSGLFSLLIGGISARLSQDYFAIGTLAFAAIVSALLINWKSLTRGVLGIPGIPRPELFGIDFNINENFLYLLAAFVVISQLVFFFLFQGPYARRLKAQAEYEPAAVALAINSRLVRNSSFFIASCFAGLAGAFFAYYINYIDPSSFSLLEMVFVLTVIVVGKPGSFLGCLFSVVFLVLLPEVFRFVDLPASILGPMRQLLYAVVLFLVVFINRATLFPVERRV